MRAKSDYNQNNVTKRGVVVDRDPKKMRVKVNFEDEDETVSKWVDVLARSSGSTKSFMMPDKDDEVWCAFDPKGEDGCVVGSKYNDKDTPPHSTNDDVSLVGDWGSFHLDKSTGNVTLDIQGDLTIKAKNIFMVKG